MGALALTNSLLRERTERIQKRTVQAIRGRRKWVIERTDPVPAIWIRTIWIHAAPDLPRR